MSLKDFAHPTQTQIFFILSRRSFLFCFQETDHSLDVVY
jgi:hypothetical protein